MDLSKIGRSNWSSHASTESEDDIATLALRQFKTDIDDPRYSETKLKELLAVTRESSTRQLFDSPIGKIQASSSHGALLANSDIGISDGAKHKASNPAKILRKKIEAANLLSVQERPSNRKQIAELEHYLLSQVRDLLSEPVVSGRDTDGFGAVKKTREVKFILTRKKICAEFNIEESDLSNLPYLDRLIVSECLDVVWDDIASRFCDMVTVSSAELGGLMRKLRRTYRQHNQQLRTSWNELYDVYTETLDRLSGCEERIRDLEVELEEKEAEIRRNMEDELRERSAKLELLKADDDQRLSATENELEQTRETLKTLNSIFKTMQTDSTFTSAGDFRAKYERIQREVQQLRQESALAEEREKSLMDSQALIAKLERQLKQQEFEISSVRTQLNKRDETIATLMERDALRTAEIEKLQKMANLLAEKEEDKDVEFMEPPTSILCVKCKKGLDDLTNIRAAVIGPNRNEKLTCKAFRILLPNIKGRRPNRANDWIRLCMRSILLTKMKEDVSLYSIRGIVTRFPEFVYAWFEPGTGPGGVTPTHDMLLKADEDRWGFYYGVKVFSRDDPESALFFSLLDESYGEDGLAFVLYCMSVAFSIGGDEFWKQFQPCLSHASSITALEETFIPPPPPSIWMPLKTAKDAVRAVFVKAMEAQVREALESIEALKQLPEVGEVEELKGDTENDQRETNSNEKLDTSGADKSEGSNDATHINFFTWLRLMLRRYEQERNQRAAAVRLMFETASIGALTPHASVAPSIDGVQQHVEFPQFQSVLRTLCPNISLAEIAHLYAVCFDEGNKFVTAEVFMRVADHHGIFSRSMRLPPLPALVQPTHSTQPDVVTTKELETTEKQVSDIRSSQEMMDVARSLAGLSGSGNDAFVSEFSLLGIESKLRVNLGAIVHRKLQAIMPELRVLMTTLPERWKSLLQELIESVQVSLKDSWLRSRKRDHSSALELAKSRAGSNIDGIQPFVAYQRLITTALAIRAITTNPILPGELFKCTRNNMIPSAKMEILRAGKLLTSLENALLIHSRGDGKYFRFDKSIRGILSQRLKVWYQNCAGAKNVVIPISVRKCMRPGYLRCRNQLRLRKVIEEPWWGQTLISCIYFTKLQYDRRAMISGHSPLSLANAAMSTFLCLWGNCDIAERFLHDMFLCCRLYESSLPRMRLFMCFLGAETELDPDSRWLLRSDRALSLYLDLVTSIRKASTILPSGTSMHGKDTCMFPSSETKSFTQRDYWYESKDVLRTAVCSWVKILEGVGSETFVQYLDVLEKDGLVDVDDFLWIAMTQWTRSTKTFLVTAKDKLNWLKRQETVISSSGGDVMKSSARKSLLSLYRIGDVMESIYSKKNKDIVEPANISVDIAYGSTLYMTALGKLGTGSPVSEMVRTWVLWDLMSPTGQGLRFDSAFQYACPSHLSAGLAIKGWSSLRDTVASFISEKATDLKDSASEQDKRQQLVRRLKLKLDEHFLHVSLPLEADASSDELKFPAFNDSQCDEIWHSLRSLYSLFGEMLENMPDPIYTVPPNAWKSGTRLHMEKSPVYSVQAKTQSYTSQQQQSHPS